jgi:hypothetical protein
MMTWVVMNTSSNEWSGAREIVVEDGSLMRWGRQPRSQSFDPLRTR